MAASLGFPFDAESDLTVTLVARMAGPNPVLTLVVTPPGDAGYCGYGAGGRLNLGAIGGGSLLQWSGDDSRTIAIAPLGTSYFTVVLVLAKTGNSVTLNGTRYALGRDLGAGRSVGTAHVDLDVSSGTYSSGKTELYAASLEVTADLKTPLFWTTFRGSREIP